MDFDALYYPHPSRRVVTYGARGMVATSQPLAAQAGLDVLKRGGNAIDAAIAAAAALTVVEPTSNGIGGDAFALVWTGGRLHGLNSSGPAPRAISIEALERDGVREMPRHGWLPVTVPGAPAAWSALSERFGRLPLDEVLEPAAQYAERGFPVAPITAKYWALACQRYLQELRGDEFREWFTVFAPAGRAPRPGELWRSPAHANTLRAIGRSKAAAFYEGDLADRIDAYSRQHGGYLRKADLAAFSPQWVDPVRINYRGFDVWELPPNGQGIVALMALNILNGFELFSADRIDALHWQIEAVKLAFADGKRCITDPDHMTVPVEALLSPAYAEERRRQIGTEAITPAPGQPLAGGTVYLATADAEGNMVSFIQSNYMGFGSGLVVPGTGIALQNRGHSFSLQRDHANRLEPGKRTYHTIIPGFLSKDGQPLGPFGVMGGHMQPQGHVQVVVNCVDYGLNPQAALDAPRWQWIDGLRVTVERTLPGHLIDALARRGHAIEIARDEGEFGRGQIIWRHPDGVLAGGTEPRTDGAIAVW